MISWVLPATFGWLPVALGLFLATKQYMVFAAPAIVLLAPPSLWNWRLSGEQQVVAGFARNTTLRGGPGDDRIARLGGLHRSGPGHAASCALPR